MKALNIFTLASNGAKSSCFQDLHYLNPHPIPNSSPILYYQLSSLPKQTNSISLNLNAFYFSFNTTLLIASYSYTPLPLSSHPNHLTVLSPSTVKECVLIPKLDRQSLRVHVPNNQTLSLHLQSPTLPHSSF